MRERAKTVLIAFATALLLVLVAMSYLMLAEPSVSSATCDRIQLGMTLQEVTTMLGGPADHCSSLTYAELLAIFLEWEDLEGNVLIVEFDNGRVAKKQFMASQLVMKERIKRKFQAFLNRLESYWKKIGG